MKKILLTVAILLCGLGARADEGMWLVNMIEGRLHAQMAAKGLQLDGSVIYDEDSASLSDAVVALAFRCSGSMISQDGLLITNHHCAYDNLHALSTPEHNYLKDGFWAFTREEEMPVPGEEVYFLKKIIDVTPEVTALRQEYNVEAKPMAMRRVYRVIEKKYQERFEGRGEVICSSYWGGKKYFMALYQVYKDVRIVAAPPESIASFGAEVDNWEWPQHKGDFTIYRVYTAPDGSPATYAPENVPLHPKKILNVSAEGVGSGDFVMVMGYPGVTNRYASAARVSNILTVENPVQAEMRLAQMKIIDRWMNADPSIRLKYADYYFSLSNVQEVREGEIYCYNRFNVVARKAAEQDDSLQEWIDEDASRKAQYGTLISDLWEKYRAAAPIELQKGCYREAIVRGIRCHRIVNTLHNEARIMQKAGKKSFTLSDNEKLRSTLSREYGKFDLRVEREIMDYCLDRFYAHVEPRFRGAFLDSLYNALGSSQAVSEYIWNNSIFTDTLKLYAFTDERHTMADCEADPMYRMVNSTRIIVFDEAITPLVDSLKADVLEKTYKSLLYDMRLEKGIEQYADANSTMRITYGSVCNLEPRDAVTVADHTTTAGLLEKYDPARYIYCLKPDVKSLFENKDWGRWADKDGNMTVNFLSNCDITGGNSGSPVLNAGGELVGLAFDGNKESLAGDTYYDPQMNRCINVDIRYVMWILDKYMGMNGIVDEIMQGR